MNTKLIICVLTYCLLISTGSAAAQTPIGSAFTYQGQLKSAGAPVNGGCDFQFSLWNAAGSGSPPTGGAQIGATQILTATVTSGLFTVVLNAGNEFGGSAFTGEARWLQVAVRCPAGSGAYTTLSPRQALTATPYAFSLKPDATVNGLHNTGNLSFGATTRQMLNLWGAGYGIGVQNSTLYFRTNTAIDGFAWYAGGTHDDAPYSPGFLGQTYMTLKPEGLAVGGPVTATTNSASPGAAMTAHNLGNGYGLYAQSDSGVGLVAEGAAHGIVGSTSSINHSGIYGSNSNGGAAVTGVSNTCNSFPCAAVGVIGKSVNPGNSGGTGVYGEGDRIGVEGVSLLGVGVRGGSGATNGVAGVSAAATASGVYGENLSGGYGVAGRANGDNPAVYGDHTGAGGIGVSGRASGLNGKAIYGYINNCAAGLNCYAVYADGNFAVAPGWNKSAIVHTADYGDRHLYAMESPENWFEDFGLDRLVNGRAVVQIDPIFAQTVNLNEDYHVFLTPRDGFANLYVANLTPTSFEVRDDHGTANLAFSYRIIAKRAGFETMRLSPAGPLPGDAVAQSPGQPGR